MRQADIFLQSQGDAWFDRNHDSLGLHDPVSQAIEDANITPERVLEVGCSNGWRLTRLRRKYRCFVAGVEPSDTAGIEALKDGIRMYKDTADALPKDQPPFDLLIYGFCLYLTDPQDWLRIAFEGDRVLKEGGYLVIHDFFEGRNCFARRYEHRRGVLSYHFDFAQLWLAHPGYHLVRREIVSGEEAVVVLRKKLMIEVRL